VQYSTYAVVSLFLACFTKRVSNVCYHKYTSHKFSKFLWCSISSLPGKGLRIIFSLQVSQ